MNMTDMAHLRYHNIHDEYLVFERAKTRLTSRSNPRPISLFITEDMKRIIEMRGNQPRLKENYIFPVLDVRDSLMRQREKVQQLIQTTNKWMKHIGTKLGIEKPVTTYAAHHSFSTVLKRSGASIEFISESLGHHDVRTSEHYLDSFENETKKHFAQSLTAFKRPNFNQGAADM